MDFKEAWNSIVNSFFAIFFAMQLSAVIMWDQGLLKWITDFNSNWLLISLSALSLTFLFAYFLIDWLDATLVSSFDKKTTRKDVILWILSPTFHSIVTVLIIKTNAFNVIFIALIIHFIVKIFSLGKRDEYADSKIENLTWNSDDPTKYNRIQGIYRFNKELFWIHIVFFIGYFGYGILILSEFIVTTNFWSIHKITISFIILLLSLILNFILKFKRHKYILTELHIKSLETT